MMEQIAIDNGFESMQEMFMLIGKHDISTPEKLARFEKWKAEDGSKKGLLELNAKDGEYRLLELLTREEIEEQIDIVGVGGLTHTEEFIYSYVGNDPDFYKDLLLLINEQRQIVLQLNNQDGS